MIEAYRIGVNLVMDKTLVTGPLGDVLRAFEAIQAAQRATQANLNEFASGIRAATKATDGLAAAWRNVASAAGRAASAAGRAGASGSGISSAASGSAGSSGLPAPFYGYPVGRPQTNSGSLMYGGGGSMTVGASPQLLLGGFGGGGTAMPPMNYGGGLPAPLFGQGAGTSGGVSMASAVNAVNIIDRLVTGVGHLVERSAAFNDALVKLEQRGTSPAAVKDLEKTVFGIDVPGRSLQEKTNDAGTLRAVFGEKGSSDPLGDVKKFLPLLETTAAALSGSTGVSHEEAIHMLVRAIENAGGATDKDTHKISGEVFEKSLEAAYKALMAAGGIISERDLLNLSQQGAVVAKAMGDYAAFLRMNIAPLIDQKGSRAGTGLQAAGRQLFGGKMTKETAIELGKILGVGEEEGFTTDKEGFKVLKATLMDKIAEDIKGGLQAFIENDIRPGLVAHGFVTDEQQSKEIFKIAGTDTFRRILSLFLANADQVLKDQNLMDKVPSVHEAIDLLDKKSIGFNIHAMTTSVGDFFNVLEKVNVDNIIAITHAVKGFFDFLAAGQKGKENGDISNKSLIPNPLDLLKGPDKKHWFWDKKAWNDDDNMAPTKPVEKGEKLSFVFEVDGKRLAMINSNYTADQLSRAPTGRSGADIRVSPMMPGMSTAFG